MASNPRRIVMDGFGIPQTEIDDFNSWSLVYNRNGGFVSATIQLLRPFRDYRGLDNPNYWFDFYYDDVLIFQGRPLRCESSWNDRQMSIVFEGRSAWLKEIYGTIDINETDYPLLFSDSQIDVQNIVRQLHTTFISGETPTGFHGENKSTNSVGSYYHSASGNSYSINPDTGVKLDRFVWDGTCSLWDVFESLSLMVGGYAWGFAEPWTSGGGDIYGLFYFQKFYADGTYPTRVDTYSMVKPDDETLSYVNSCKEIKQLDYDIGRLDITGAYDTAMQRRLTYSRTNTGSTTNKITKIYAPWINNPDDAEQLADTIFATYTDIIPKYDFTIRSLTEVVQPGANVYLYGETGLLSTTMPQSIDYELNMVFNCSMNTGNLLDPQEGIKGLIDKEIQKQIDQITARPAYGAALQGEIYTNVVRWFKVTQATPTIQIQLIDEAGTAYGDVYDATVFSGHSDAVAVNQIVQAVWTYNNDDQPTRVLKIVNLYSLAT